MPEPAGRDELHRPCRRGVVDLDLVVHARVGDVDALGIAVVEDGETAAREPGGHGALGRSLLLDRGVRTWERVGNDREVRLVGADVDAVRQIAHVDLAVAGLRQLVGEAALRAEPEDRMLDLGGEVSELGPAWSRSRRRPVPGCSTSCRRRAAGARPRDRPRPRSRSPLRAGTAVARQPREGSPDRPHLSRGHDRPGPGRGRVEHLDLVRDARVGDVDALRVVPRRRRRGRRRKA